MHTVDASSNPSDSVVEFSASNIRVCRDSAALGEPQTSSPHLGTRTMAFDQTLHPSQNNQKIPSANGFATTASSQIPSWKRILDIACIIAQHALLAADHDRSRHLGKTGFSRPHFLSAGARRVSAKALHDPEVQNHEGERRNPKS